MSTFKMPLAGEGLRGDWEMRDLHGEKVWKGNYSNYERLEKGVRNTTKGFTAEPSYPSVAQWVESKNRSQVEVKGGWTI